MNERKGRGRLKSPKAVKACQQSVLCPVCNEGTPNPCKTRSAAVRENCWRYDGVIPVAREPVDLAAWYDPKNEEASIHIAAPDKSGLVGIIITVLPKKGKK